MAKTKISEFSSTPANNTDIDSINIAEGCAPSGINDAIRELMSQLKDWQSGASNDPYVVGSSGSLTLNQGTANGVLYLNGSKVATSGSALTFDGTNLGVGTSSPAYKLDVNGTIRGAGDVISSATNPLFQGSSSTGSAAISNNTAGAYIRVYGSAHATRANYTDFINGSSTSTFDSSGNLGLGVTPSAWSIGKAIDISASGAVFGDGVNSAYTAGLSQNAYNQANTWKYKLSSQPSARYEINGAAHAWYNASSGTAGNAITFTQAMTLSSAGNLLVGSTSDSGSKLQVGASSGATTSPTAIEIDNTYSSSAAYNRLKLYLFKGASETYGFSVGDLADIQYWAGSSSTGVHRWFTSQTERARIDSSGNLLVGTTSQLQAANSRLNVAGDFYNGNGVSLKTTNDGSSAQFVGFLNGSGTLIGSINRVTTTNAVVYNTTSDYRLKTVTGVVSGQGARIDALKPVDYLWTEGGQQARGFLAHEFQAVYPNSVSGTKDAVDSSGNPIYQAMQASTPEVIADLVAEIQSLRKRLADAGL